MSVQHSDVLLEGCTVIVRTGDQINTFTYRSEQEAQTIYDATIASLQERGGHATQG